MPTTRHHLDPQIAARARELPFAAIVLAGERVGPSPVAEQARVCCKALAPVHGEPMVLRVLDALNRSRYVDRRLLCGPDRSAFVHEPRLELGLARGDWVWCESELTPSASAVAALTQLEADEAVLLTTADHALLTPEIVDYFCEKALATGADAVAGLARFATVQEAFPESRRTVLKFSDDGYCGCNLFAFLSPKGRTLPEFWQRVERQRKRPWRLLRVIGWRAVVRYLLGRLSLQEAVATLEARLGLKLAVVLMPYPEAAVDVDKPEDLALVNRLAREREG